MTRYCIDEEFQDDGKTITLISIGLVCEDGREFYGQSTEFDLRNGNDWVWDNVYPHLEVCPYKPSELDRAFCCKHKQGKCTLLPEGEERNRCPWRTREQLKQDILAFLDPEKYGKPEFYGWITGYDYVAFCQLFGTMIDLPKDFPHYIHDLQPLLDARGITDDMLPQQEVGLHHALADARHIQKIWQMLEQDEGETWTPDQIDAFGQMWNALTEAHGKPPTVVTTTQVKWQLRKMGLLKEE